LAVGFRGWRLGFGVGGWVSISRVRGWGVSCGAASRVECRAPGDRCVEGVCGLRCASKVCAGEKRMRPRVQSFQGYRVCRGHGGSEGCMWCTLHNNGGSEECMWCVAQGSCSSCMTCGVCHVVCGAGYLHDSIRPRAHACTRHAHHGLGCRVSVVEGLGFRLRRA
jgi:hypothetical protein